MTNLNPCPFCNTIPILQHTRETGFYIHCPTCQSYTHGVQWSRQEAVAVWNNRPDPWVRIDPGRVETLPPELRTVLLSFSYDGRGYVDKAYQLQGTWYRLGQKAPVEPLTSEDAPYAWQPWPEPAVYEDETP